MRLVGGQLAGCCDASAGCQDRTAPTWHRFGFRGRVSGAGFGTALPATNPGAQLCRLHCSTHNGHKGHVCTDYQIRPLYVQIDIVMFQVLLAVAHCAKLIECCRQCRLRDFFRTPKTRRANWPNCRPWTTMDGPKAGNLAKAGKAGRQAGQRAEGRQAGGLAGRDLQQF